jgi:hypothetical protein
MIPSYLTFVTVRQSDERRKRRGLSVGLAYGKGGFDSEAFIRSTVAVEGNVIQNMILLDADEAEHVAKLLLDFVEMSRANQKGASDEASL